MFESPFWIVVNEKSPTTVTYHHGNYDSAIEEAKRLARRNPGDKFVVMEAKKSFCIDNLVETEYSDIPF